MNATLTNRIAPAGHRRAILFGLIGAFLMGITVAYALTNTNLGSQSLRLGRETFADDVDVTVSSQRIFKLKSSDVASPVGDTAPGVEITSGLPQVNNNLVRNRYAYEFLVQESGATTLQAAENLQIDVYMDDGTTTSLLATLYTQQGTVNDGAVEGVTVTVNTGQTNVMGDSFSIVVTRQ